MLSKPATTKFQTRQTFAKTTLTHKKVFDNSDSHSDHSTSDGSKSSKKNGAKFIYTPKKKIDFAQLEDPNLPTNSSWKKGTITKSEDSAPHKTLVVSSESIKVVKSTTHLKALLESLMAHKSIAAFFAESDSINKVRGTEHYESFPSAEATVEDVEEMVKKSIMCSFRKIHYHHHSTPTFGYLVHYEHDERGNLIPTILPELVAFSSLPNLLKDDILAFEMENVVRFHKKDSTIAYHYWIPVYLNDEHYDYVKDLLKNVLVRLSGLNKAALPEFQPSMVEEVLVPMFARLLAKVQRGKDTSGKDVQALAFLFQMISKLADIFPKVKESITEKVESFLNEENVEKIGKNDIDAFLVNALFCSFDVFDHNLASQFFEKVARVSINLCLKAKGKTDVESVLFALNSASKLLARFNETAFFLLNKETADDFENRFGVLCKERVEAFYKHLAAINEVKDWSVSKLSHYFGDAVNGKRLQADLKACVHL